MNRHTPGPWVATAHGFIKAGSKAIAVVALKRLEFDANARLIASAPDLLEALKALLDRADRYSYLSETKDWPEQAMARSAIAKAEDPQCPPP